MTYQELRCIDNYFDLIIFYAWNNSWHYTSIKKRMNGISEPSLLIESLVSRVSTHGRLNITRYLWVLTQDQNSVHLYRSCYSGPLKCGTWVLGACPVLYGICKKLKYSPYNIYPHRLSSWTTETAVLASSPVVGSSRNSTWGSMMSSMPMLVRFLSPPDTPRMNSVPICTQCHNMQLFTITAMAS